MTQFRVIEPKVPALGDLTDLRAYAIRMVAVGNELLDMIAEEKARQIEAAAAKLPSPA
jgi:hypothetical protein